MDELAALNRAMECSAPAAYQRPEELPLTIALINDSLIETNETAVALKYTEDGRPTLFISPYLVQQGRPTDLDSIDEDETESWQASFMRQLAWKSAIDCGKFPLTEEESKQLGWVPIKFNQGARLFALRSKNGCLFRPYEEPITTDKVWARCSEEGNYLNSFGEPAINTAEIEFLTVEQMSHLAEVNPCSERFLNAEEEIVEALCMFRRGSQLRARLKRESPSLYDIAKNLDQLSIDRCYEPIANHCQFLRATDGLLVENNDANQQAIMNFEETQLVNK